MRVQTISPNFNVGKAEVKYAKINEIERSDFRRSVSNVIKISFTGNAEKNPNQFVSIAPEHKGIGLKNYDIGGLSCVADEAPNSWVKHYGADVRSFLPYHCYENADGKIKVVKVKKEASGKPILSAKPEDFRIEDLAYVLKEDEKFVIQDAPVKGQCNFRIIDDTGIGGSVKRVSEKGLDEATIPYKLFKMAGREGKDTVYIVHTPVLAKAPKSYGYTEGWEVIHYADFNRAVAEDILPKLNIEAHGNFNPANIWLHDRPAFLTIPCLVDKAASGDSYYQGLRVHSTFHNPGRAYQGFTTNPIEHFKLIANVSDLAKLRAHPDFHLLADIESRMEPNKELSHVDMAVAKRILDPFLRKTIDDVGTYNISMVPLAAIRENPANYTGGSVSVNYGKEMIDHNMPDIAYGLTRTMASLPLINITNGSTPANLKLDDPNAGFGRGGNVLTEQKANFSTYKPAIEYNVIVNAEEIIAKKHANKKWLIGLIAEKAKEGQDALNRVFFNQEQISPSSDKKIRPSSVLGGFSQFEEGDKLWVGFGRPDPQKGFPIKIQSFLEFLKNPNISEDIKMHQKFLAGAGPDPWTSEKDSDWVKIQKLVKDIQELDGGKYKGNICYVDGMFPNRLLGCADFSIFSSRYEPCGITPLESAAAGTPVVSIRTGGAPDFIREYVKNPDSATGFLTKRAFKVAPEIIGEAPDIAEEALDDARINASAKELMREICQAVTLDDAAYVKMLKNNLLAQIDWHQNGAFNGGMSANQRYMREIFRLDDSTSKLEFLEKRASGIRPSDKIHRLVDEFGGENLHTIIDSAKNTAADVAKKATGMSKKAIALYSLAGVAVAGLAYYFVSKKPSEQQKSTGSSVNSSNRGFDKYSKARVNSGFSRSA